MLVFWTVWKLKTPRLRGFLTPTAKIKDRCNFAREHGIGGINFCHSCRVEIIEHGALKF